MINIGDYSISDIKKLLFSKRRKYPDGSIIYLRFDSTDIKFVEEYEWLVVGCDPDGSYRCVELRRFSDREVIEHNIDPNDKGFRAFERGDYDDLYDESKYL